MHFFFDESILSLVFLLHAAHKHLNCFPSLTGTRCQESERNVKSRSLLCLSGFGFDVRMSARRLNTASSPCLTSSGARLFSHKVFHVIIITVAAVPACRSLDVGGLIGADKKDFKLGVESVVRNGAVGSIKTGLFRS